MTDGTCDAPGCDLDATEALMSGPNAGEEYCAYHATALTPHFLTAEEARQHGVPQDTQAWKENATGAIRLGLPDGRASVTSSGVTTILTASFGGETAKVVTHYGPLSERQAAKIEALGQAFGSGRKFDPNTTSFPVLAALETLGITDHGERGLVHELAGIYADRLYGRQTVSENRVYQIRDRFEAAFPDALWRRQVTAALRVNMKRAAEFATRKAIDAQEAREAEELEQQAEAEIAKRVTFVYTNHRGITETRHALPIKIHFGTTEYHTEPQWFFQAFDTDKKVTRDFALRDCQFQGVYP